jgi:predicted permease
MSLLTRFRSLRRNLLGREAVERDLDDELQSTLSALIEEHESRGLSAEEARRAALVELRVEPVKEQIRDAKAGVMVERSLQDLRYAWRHVRRSPGFAMAAMLTLALGIGANTAMFSMLDALLWERLAIDEPDGLIAIAPRTARGLDRSTPVDAIAHLEDGPLTPLCGYLGGIVLPVLANGVPVQASTTFVTAACLDAFRIRPVLGRNFTGDEAPILTRGARLALITDRLWQRVYGGDPQVLGRTIQVNNVELGIIGVLPPGFVGLEVDHGVDIYTPFDTVLLATPTRRQLAGYLLGRLRPGVTFEAAEAELRTRWPALLDAVLPATIAPSELANFRDSQVRLERMGTGRSIVRTRYGDALSLIFGLTVMLLVLACVNLGGLLLARLTGRSSELSVRLALGGTRWRIAQQMLMESLLLAGGGAVLAVPVAYAIVSLLVALLPAINLPITMSFMPDAGVLASLGAVALLAGVAMTALPLWIAMRRRAGSYTSWDRTIAGANSRWGRVLLVAQVAVSLVLLVGAALLTRSLYLLQHHDLGIRSAGIVTVRTLPLPGAANNQRNSLSDFNLYLERLAGLPGVRGVGFSRSFPRGGTTPGVPIQFVGGEQTGLLIWSDYVSSEFFSMLGIPLLSGRSFTRADDTSREPVVVVSESLARALSPDGNVIGRRIKFGPVPVDQDRVIVGIVGNATHGNPREAAPFIVYRPLQLTATTSLSGNLLIATDDPPSAMSGAREMLREFGRDYAVEISTVDEVIARTPASERMSAAIGAAVGGLAVLLAFIGVHGVLAYAVGRRRREIGVRVAIGATPASIAWSIVREGLTVTAIGVAIGVPLAMLGARSLKSLMFGISEIDAVTFAAATIFFLALGAAAGGLPARRAAQLDPVKALRAE